MIWLYIFFLFTYWKLYQFAKNENEGEFGEIPRCLLKALLMNQYYKNISNFDEQNSLQNLRIWMDYQF